MKYSVLSAAAKRAGLGLAGMLIAGTANATVLTFEQNNQGAGAPMDQNYGDNVTGTSNAAGNYGQGAEGTTLNVVASYLVGSNSDPKHWTTGYSDLSGVYYNEIDSQTPLELTLTADAGFKVVLHGFDLGNFSGALTLPAVQVFNESNVAVFSQSQVSLPSNINPHISFDFANPLMGQSLRISIDLTGLGGASDNVGMDNVEFGQAEVPVPGAAALLGTVVIAGAAAAHRRKRQS